MSMRVQILSDAPLGSYTDTAARALLEGAIQRVLAAESELRAATQQLAALGTRCRASLVDQALKDLAARRPH